MKLGKHFTMGLGMAALALGLTAVRASAEPVLTGSFELPAATYWGDTLLQPGQYTISMSIESRDIARVPVVHLSGEGKEVTLLGIARPMRESGRNYLEVANIDGTYVIRAFDAGLIGQTLSFGVTKTAKNKALRASAQPVMTVPVSGGAGL